MRKDLLFLISNRLIELLVKQATKETIKVSIRPQDVMSEIDGIYYIPDPQKLEQAKELNKMNMLSKDQIKFYLAGDWN